MRQLTITYSALSWTITKIYGVLTVYFFFLGIAGTLLFMSSIIVFNPAFMTNKAVVFYRSQLPKRLTKQESKQVAELKALSAKLNKESNAYQERKLIIISKNNSIPKEKK